MPTAIEEKHDATKLCTRQVTVQSTTLDREAATIDAVITTEGMVQVYDNERWEIVDEILVAEGVEFPEQIPLLADHNRWSVDQQYGSARGLRRSRKEVIGTLHFSKTDENAVRTFNKVAEGHIRNVSAGYLALESTYIPAGQKGTVNGKTYKAGAERTLRVTTKSRLFEVSVVVIGADQDSVMRSFDQREPAMSQKQITKRGALFTTLRELVDEQAQDGDREELVAELAEAAELEADQVDTMLEDGIEDVSEVQLEGMAAVLDVETDELVAAAEADGHLAETT